MQHCAELIPAGASSAITASRRTRRLLPRRIQNLTAEIRELEKLQRLVISDLGAVAVQDEDAPGGQRGGR